MSLVIKTLQDAFIAAYDKAELEAKKPDANNQTIKETLALEQATAIDAFVKSALVTSTHAIALVAPPSGGPVTGTIETENVIS